MKEVKYRGQIYRQEIQDGFSGICKGCKFDDKSTLCKLFSEHCSPKSDGSMLIFKLKRHELYKD